MSKTPKTDGHIPDDQTPDEMRSPILDAVMAHVPFDGWSEDAITAAASELGLTRGFVSLAFPRGAEDMVDFYLSRIDAEMTAELDKLDVDSIRIRDRISTAIKIRMEINARHREVVARTVSWLALPMHAPLATKAVWRMADIIWRWAGDVSVDYNHYTKRVILSGVYSSTLLYWLNDESDDFADTWAFLDRRIENVMQFEKAKAKGVKMLEKFPNIFTKMAEARRSDKPETRTD